MNHNNRRLTANQLNSFDRLLLEGSGGALHALENLFGLEIDQASSSIEIAPLHSSKFAKDLGDEPLYTVSSSMEGDLQGSLMLLMRASDFKCLSELMRPILCLMFLSGDSSDLASLDSEKADWMVDSEQNEEENTAFREQMMDMLAEMGNVLLGLYTGAIFKVYAMNTRHSLPQTAKDEEQRVIRGYSETEQSYNQQHLVIENEFSVANGSIRLWCLISPSNKSFQRILSKVETTENQKLVEGHMQEPAYMFS